MVLISGVGNGGEKNDNECATYATFSHGGDAGGTRR